MCSAPIKMNVLQSNSGIVNNANLNLLKVNKTVTAKADSTNIQEFDSPRGSDASPVTTDPRTGMPFKKHHHSVKKFQTPSVSRRNARERNRVKQVNDGFSMLKNHVPNLKNKTSKVDTLRAAVDYIRALRSLLGQPIKDENLHQGPVLISDIEDSQDATNMKPQRRSKKSDGGSTPTSLTNTAIPNNDFNSLIYSIPSMMLMEELDLRSPSPSSSVSPLSVKVNHSYYSDGKENMSDSFTLMGGMDLCGNQAPNWNWTNTSINEDQ